MSTPISQFSYDLPKELIAQHSVEPRDSSRLMILDRATGEIKHKHFYDILDELCAGDVLVFNDTKVFRARMSGKVVESCPPEADPPSAESRGVKEVEVFLLRCVRNVPSHTLPFGKGRDNALPPPDRRGSMRGTSLWQALLRPGKKIHIGDVITIDDIEVVVREKQKDGVVLVEFPMCEAEVITFTDTHGSIPIPPYVNEVPDDANKYQTVYAREVGSVAAPTAGFHFTHELLEKIKAKGVELAFITLHVGIGTFRPVQTETIEEHTMHAEFVEIARQTAEQINRAKKENRRVIAVGTTTVRSLEGAALSSPSPLQGEGRPALRSFSEGGGGVLSHDGFTGDINLFITPGFEFRVVDALITNFHLPKSTLLVLVSSFAGRENILAAYREAVEKKYRFFSFGDAMFIR